MTYREEKKIIVTRDLNDRLEKKLVLILMGKKVLKLDFDRDVKDTIVYYVGIA